jgi:serine/threonine protein kinase
METEKWEKISRLLERALALSGAKQQTFLDEIASAEGATVYDEVSALLRADQDSQDFLTIDAMHLAAKQVEPSDETKICPGMIFGNYKILEPLGSGGMGEVYLAMNESLGRRAALKFLSSPGLGLATPDNLHLARFEQEARAASALNHPNILTIYEIGTAHGRRFLATEYIEGKTLRARIDEQSLSLKESLDIASQLTGALGAAHQAGIVHRDIKPENIMVRPDGVVKLLDFGLVRLGSELEARPYIVAEFEFGTPRYMSPEQIRGESLDGQTDLWSLGATLFEMTTGKPLVAVRSLQEAFKEILDPNPFDLRLGEDQKHIQSLLEKALAKDRRRRFKNAPEFASEIRKVRGGLERAGSTSFGPSSWIRWVIATAFLLLVLLAGWSLQNGRSSSSVSEAQAQKLYWELSQPEKDAWLKISAQHVAGMLGESPKALSSSHLTQIKAVIEEVISKRNSLSTTPGEESPKSVYARASVYAPFISDSFRARGLPPMIGLYIAMTETGYQPCWGFVAGGRGLFGFLPQTAERYGLSLQPEDQRCDPRKMSTAAAKYIDVLTRIYGSSAGGVTLAILAYNAGENRVSSARTDLFARGIDPDSFWTLLDHQSQLSLPLLPESQAYLPRFFAYAVIGEYPEKFGLDIQRLSSYTKPL